ncbi:MAG: hypothetical protein NT150_06070 [Bacteroidetes bacterium]|nr:hypothetical protein [Bacteroidota bacterium]
MKANSTVVDKAKISETLGTLALACLVFQLVLATKLQLNENLHDYLFLLIAGFFLAISLFSLSTVGVILIGVNISVPWLWYLGITGGVLLLLSIFKVKLDWLISFGWLKLGEGMGFVMSKVVLGSVFFLLVSPLSVVYRMFNKNHMNRDKKGDSYYVTRDHLFEKKDLTNTW